MNTLTGVLSLYCFLLGSVTAFGMGQNSALKDTESRYKVGPVLDERFQPALFRDYAIRH